MPSIPAEHKLSARIPSALSDALEDERIRRSRAQGRRISTRELVEEAIGKLIAEVRA